MVDWEEEQSDKNEQIIGGRVHVLRCARCPACDFDLRGNPTANKCPECGFINEPEAIWFRPSGVLHLVLPYLIALVFVEFVWLWHSAAARGFPVWTPFDRVVMGMGRPVLCCFSCSVGSIIFRTSFS